MKKKFYRKPLSMAFLTMFFLHAPAQQNALKIGDPLPAKTWTSPLKMVNAPQKTTTLQNKPGQLILLDFWATWCSACLKNYPKMEALQQQFGDKIHILSVTTQDLPTLEKFFASKNGQRYKELKSVAEDSFFSQLFPHLAIPFVVWIKDGRLLNTTDIEQVNAKTIQQVLQGEKSTLQTVIQLSRDRPLMLAQQFDLEKSTLLMNYALFTKGKIRAIPAGSGFHRSNGITYGRQFTNLPLLNIYQGIAYELFNKKGQDFSNKRLLNSVTDKSEINTGGAPQKDSALASQLYNFEYIAPLKKADSLYANMLKTLNNFSAYSATLEIRPVKCLVLKRTSTADNIHTKGETPINDFFKTPALVRNVPLGYLITSLNESTQITSLPVIDETGYDDNVDLNLGNISNLADLKKSLNTYHLTLIEEERELLIFIIKDKP